jgi:hypothetical protein
MGGWQLQDFWPCAAKSWAPHIGDPTPVGWAMTLCYFYTAFLILYMLRKLRRINPERRTIYIQFWSIILTFYVLLGLNKQLDLQTFITATGRCMARSEGWYADRRNVQLTMILAGFAVGSSALFVFLYYFNSISSRCRLAFIGLGLSAMFVFLRAVSFHHVDVLFSMTILDLKFHAILEFTGIALVAINALRLAIPRTHRTPRERGSAHRTTPSIDHA